MEFIEFSGRVGLDSDEYQLLENGAAVFDMSVARLLRAYTEASIYRWVFAGAMALEEVAASVPKF